MAKPTVEKRLGEELLQSLAKRYEDGESIRAFCSEFKACTKTMTEAIGRRTRIRTPSESIGIAQRKDHFNQRFFETIDAPDKAYWLGFLWADGHVNDYHVVLTLQAKDIECIEGLKKAVGSNKEIKQYGPKDHRTLDLGSIAMVADLKRLNFTSRKTYDKLPPPDIDPLLEGDFWRGVIDGDGSINLGEKAIVIFGSEETMLAFRKWINQYDTCTTKIGRSGPYCWRISICKASIFRKIIPALGYLDESKTALERKRVRAQFIYDWAMTYPKPGCINKYKKVVSH